MIDRFHPGDDVHQLGVMMMNVFDQFYLCIGWTRNEDSASARERLGDCVEIVMIFRGVSAPDGVRLVLLAFARGRLRSVVFPGLSLGSLNGWPLSCAPIEDWRTVDARTSMAAVPRAAGRCV
jgi:hypothetical protein